MNDKTQNRGQMIWHDTCIQFIHLSQTVRHIRAQILNLLGAILLQMRIKVDVLSLLE